MRQGCYSRPVTFPGAGYGEGEESPDGLGEGLGDGLGEGLGDGLGEGEASGSVQILTVEPSAA